MYEDLKNKTVFITGSNRGIGYGIAKAFIENHCKTILVHRQYKPDLSDPNIIHINADIRKTEKIAAWLNDYESRGNKIDILINNAGINEYGELMSVTETAWDNLMNVNLKATFFLSQLIARHMAKNTGGVIINATSFAVKLPLSGYSVYAASKAALLSLTKSMAAEWAPYNIRVNAYAPGIVETEMTKSAISKNRERMLQDISLNRFGSSREIANTVLFLASEASSYITGTETDISGGKFLNQNPSAAWQRLSAETQYR